MVRADIRRTRILGSLGVLLCIAAVAVITWTLVQQPESASTLPVHEEINATVSTDNITNKSLIPATTLPQQKILYVLYTAENLLGIVDLEKNETKKEIAVGKQPKEMFFDAATNRIYITNQQSHTLSVIDLTQEKVIQTFKAGNSPEGIAVTNKKIYVTNPSENKVLVLDKELGFISKEIAVGSDPGQLLLSEDQRKIYVLNRGSDDITVINTAIDAFIDVWFAGDNPGHFAMSPHQRFIYISSPNGMITILPLRQPKEYDEVQAGLGAAEIAFTPNNILAAIVNTDENTLSLISLTRDMLLATIDVGVAPADVVITADARTAYVSNGASNTISVVDLQQKQRVAEFSVSNDPQRMLLLEE